jgi:serine/threonine-protein kinase
MQRSNGSGGSGDGRGLPSEAWDRLERVLERFEGAWRGGRRPDLDAYLADARAERLYLLAELVRADLEHRLGAGEVARVEAYLQRYPELRDDREAVLGLIAAEYGFRRGREPGCDPAEYLQRFPAYRQELTARLQAPPGDNDRAARPGVAGTPPGAPAAGTPGGPGQDPDSPAPGGPALRDWSAPPPTGPQPTPSGEGGTPARPAVPGYEVLGELGRGGMGVVYQARHIALDRVVALKMILRGEHEGPEQRRRFRTEAEAVARLQHPNVVQIHEVGEHDGLPFFSLEFCPGGSLERKLGGTPLPPREAARLVQTLALAMQAAHERGIVHRDLKPANVLLAEGGTPKVTDFGLAKKLDESGQTPSGAVVGTPSYMAPEQAGGKGREVGPAADVYALGAILYECLTGRPPF